MNGGQKGMETTTAPLPQHMRALKLANATRLRRAALKRRIHAGDATVLDALRERHGRHLRNATIIELLRAQRRWGYKRALKLLSRAQVRENRELGRMTDREIEWLTRELGRVAR